MLESTSTQCHNRWLDSAHLKRPINCTVCPTDRVFSWEVIENETKFVVMCDSGISVPCHRMQEEASWNRRVTMPNCRAGDVERVKTLLSNRVDVNARIRSGWTPLHKAARRGYTNLVKPLLAKGADTNAKTKKGQTALDCARAVNHTDIVELLSCDGANVNAGSRHDHNCSTIRP